MGENRILNREELAKSEGEKSESRSVKAFSNRISSFYNSIFYHSRDNKGDHKDYRGARL